MAKTIIIFAITHIDGGIKEDTTFHTTLKSAHAALAFLRTKQPVWGAEFCINACEARIISEPVTHVTYNALTDYGHTWAAAMVAHDGSYTPDLAGTGTVAHVFPQRVGRDEEKWGGWESIEYYPRRDDI